MPDWTPPPLPPPPPSAFARPQYFKWEDPSWGFPTAFVVWAGSVFLLLFSSIVFAIPFFTRQMNAGASAPEISQSLINDPKFLLWQVVSALPAHALTLLLVWVVVTRFGRQPFFKSISWGWGDWRNFFAIGGGAVAAIALLGISVLLKSKIGGGDTTIDRLIESSTAARYVVAVLAAGTAPLVEELVYRGVLYPATQRGAARLA